MAIPQPTRRPPVAFIALALLALVPAHTPRIYAQRSASTPAITALLDTLTGRFGATDAGGRTLLFHHGGRFTSHVSFRIGNETFTNHQKAGYSTAWPVTALGRPVVTMVGARLRCTWRVQRNRGTIELIEELEPVDMGGWSEVRVHLGVANGGRERVACGASVMLDVAAAGDDAAALRFGGQTEDREREIRPIPETWSAQSWDFLPDSMGGRLRGIGVTEPDRVIAGRWAFSGSLGTAVYGYQPDGQPFRDGAVYLEWTAQEVPPGGGTAWTTAVGRSTTQLARRGTFGRYFEIPSLLAYSGGDYPFFIAIYADTTTTITLRNRRSTQRWTGLPYWTPWDTTITVQPGEYRLQVTRCNFHQFSQDSVQSYQNLLVSCVADKDIGIILLPQMITLWPISVSSTAYRDPGSWPGYWPTCSHAFSQDSATSIHFGYSNAGSEVNFILSPIGVRSPANKRPVPFPPFSRMLGVHRLDSSYDAQGVCAGELIEADHPYQLYQHNAFEILSRGTPNWHDYSAQLLPSTHLGCEYPVVPMPKVRALRQGDVVRIVAYHDSTAVMFDRVGTAVRLDAGGHYDTLIEAPAVIRSDHPVAVYQYAPNRLYTQPSDTTHDGGMLQLLPPEQWGREYYYKPSLPHEMWNSDIVRKLYGGFIVPPPKTTVTIIAHRGEEALISLSGMSVPAFSSLGDGGFVYTSMQVPPTGIIAARSTRPFLLIINGGYRNFSRQAPELPRDIGFSLIPPFR